MAEIKAQGTINLTSVKSVNDLAESAQTDANAAQVSVDTVTQAVGAIQWVTNHGEYEASTDTELQPGKLYFVQDEDGYTVVTAEEGNPSELGYLELSEMKETITEYVSTHLSVDSRGLWLQTDGEAYRLCVTGTAIELWNGSGIIAEYSDDVTLGISNGLHIVLSSGELGFYEGTNKVAWISTSQLNISDAKITNTLQIGNFAFVQRSGRLTLKYIGG